MKKTIAAAFALIALTLPTPAEELPQNQQPTPAHCNGRVHSEQTIPQPPQPVVKVEEKARQKSLRVVKIDPKPAKSEIVAAGK